MTSEQRKNYFKKYYKDNKAKYAEYKRYRYWRNKARQLCEDEVIIMSMSLNSLKMLCAEHLN